MDRRRFLLTSLMGALAAPLGAKAQHVGKAWRIGYLGPSRPAAPFTEFRQALGRLGYVEGKNLILEQRYAEDRLERLPRLAAELVNLHVDVLVTIATPATLTAKAATATIPIVMLAGDPVGVGIVQSLNRPGGNITGVALNNVEVAAKRLQLLAEAVPKLSRVAVLANQMNPTFTALQAGQTRKVAERMGVAVQMVEVRGPGGLADAFVAMSREHAEAAIILPDPTFRVHRKRIAELALQHRLPSTADDRRFVEAGGLLSYAPDYDEINRRLAWFVDRVLKGAKPAELPVEDPTKFELVINLKTAKALGLTIPQSVLVRADEVIQ
jgi:putative ABC transport system substrate-binding protein